MPINADKETVAEVEIKVPVAANDYVVDHDLEAGYRDTPNIDDAKDDISGQENERQCLRIYFVAFTEKN